MSQEAGFDVFLYAHGRWRHMEPDLPTLDAAEKAAMDIMDSHRCDEEVVYAEIRLGGGGARVASVSRGAQGTLIVWRGQIQARTVGGAP